LCSTTILLADSHGTSCKSYFEAVKNIHTCTISLSHRLRVIMSTFYFYSTLLPLQLLLW
jgi:hypothetical protein